MYRRDDALLPYRVLDLSDEFGFLCGKILGDLGADVLLIEAPGGHPARKIGPFVQDDPDPEKSLFWLSYNNNKRGITLDLEAPEGQELLKWLVQTADFVIESFPPGYLKQLSLDYEELSRLNKGLVFTSITPYGQGGPCSGYRASDLEIMATSGCMSLTGEADGPPLRVSLPQSTAWSGLYAAVGTLIAHYHRQQTGEGQHVDASAQSSTLWAHSHAYAFWHMNRELQRRSGPYVIGRSVTGAKMRVFWPCKDGYVNFIIYGGPAGRKTNRALVEWMESKGMGSKLLREKDWESFEIAQVTQKEIDEIERELEGFFCSLTKKEFLEGVLERNMLGYPVNTVPEILKDAQLQSRDYWQKVEHPELRQQILYPGPFAQLEAGTCGVRRRAPRIGEHNEEVYGGELGLTEQELSRLRKARVI